MQHGVRDNLQKPTASSKNYTRHHEETVLVHDREMSCVTEETLTKDVSFIPEICHRKKTSILTILCPAAATRSSLQSVSADSLMPASVTRRPSFKFKTLIVLATGSGFRFFTFIKCALHPNFHKMLQDWLLVMGVQQFQEIFSLRK